MLLEFIDMIYYHLTEFGVNSNPISLNKQRNRSHESTPVNNKDLMDFIQELKRNNEELRHSNRLLSQKLEQTMDIMKEGFKSLQNVLARSTTDPLPRRILDPDIKQWNVDSESSSIISGVSESPVHEGYVMCFPDRTVTSSDDHSEGAPQSEAGDTHVLSNTSKERFGFEYDSNLDVNLWLRK